MRQLVNEFKETERDFERAVKAFEKFKQKEPYFNRATISDTCVCSYIRGSFDKVLSGVCLLGKYQIGGWFDDKSSCPEEYQILRGSLIDTADKEHYENLSEIIEKEIDILIQNTVAPLIELIRKQTLPILLEQSILTTSSTREMINKRTYHEEAVRASWEKLLATQQRISDLLLDGLVDFETLPVGKRKQLPRDVSGIYILWLHGEPDYIGQSKNIRERLSSSHATYNKDAHLITAIIGIEDRRRRLDLERSLTNMYLG